MFAQSENYVVPLEEQTPVPKQADAAAAATLSARRSSNSEESGNKKLTVARRSSKSDVYLAKGDLVPASYPGVSSTLRGDYDYTADKRDDAPAQNAAPATSKLERARIDSRSEAAAKLSGGRRSSRDVLLTAGIPAPHMSIAAMIDPEFTSAPSLRDREEMPESSVTSPSLAAPESAIERARQLNYQASIARGDAPQRRPSLSQADLAAKLQASSLNARPVAATLLGH